MLRRVYSFLFLGLLAGCGGSANSPATTVAPVPMGGHIQSLSGPAVSAAHIFVTNAGNNTVTAYDHHGNQVTLTGTFPNLNLPAGLTWDAHVGFFYVTNPGNSTVTAYDAQGNQQTLSGDDFKTAIKPRAIAHDSSVQRLYVGIFPPSYAVSYDEVGNERFRFGLHQTKDVAGIAVDIDNSLIYIASQFNGSGSIPYVSAFNTLGVQQTLSGTWANAVSPKAIGYDGHNKLIYVVNGNKTVTAYDAMGNQQSLTGFFLNLHNPTGIAYDPDDGFIYVTDSGNNTVQAFDEQGNHTVLSGTFPNLNKPAGIVVVP